MSAHGHCQHLEQATVLILPGYLHSLTSSLAFTSSILPTVSSVNFNNANHFLFKTLEWVPTALRISQCLLCPTSPGWSALCQLLSVPVYSHTTSLFSHFAESYLPFRALAGTIPRSSLTDSFLSCSSALENPLFSVIFPKNPSKKAPHQTLSHQLVLFSSWCLTLHDDCAIGHIGVLLLTEVGHLKFQESTFSPRTLGEHFHFEWGRQGRDHKHCDCVSIGIPGTRWHGGAVRLILYQE